MYKIFTLLRRTPESDYYEFREFLRGDFITAVLRGKAARSINKIVTYNLLEHDFRPTTNAERHHWSGVAAFWFDDKESALGAAIEPEFIAAARVRTDMVAEVSHTVAREVPISGDEAGGGPTKVFAFFKNSLPKGNPMSRAEMFVRWNEHAGRMKGHQLDQLMNRFTQNQIVPDFHATNPRYDYDGVSEIWFPSVEAGEALFKNYDSELRIIPSSAQMGGTAGDCVYLRTDEVEVFRRGN
jgi:hypothetical protein